MKKSERRRLVDASKDCGAENISLEQNGHYKLKFSHAGNKALVTIGSTPSDHRARKNMVSTIRRELKRIGIEDQRFTVGLVLVSRPRPENAIWNLLDEWSKKKNPILNLQTTTLTRRREG